MTVVFLPRLDRLAVDSILEKLKAGSNEEVAIAAVNNLPDAMTFAATGGRPAGGEDFQLLRSGIVDIARKHGYGDTSAHSASAAFDAEASVWLATLPLLDSGEALRDEVWAFITAALVPSVVLWRYGLVAERFHGGIRNTFQRLWIRGRALDRGPNAEDRWGLLRDLTEDALVQITERPAVGADPVLACAIGEGWVRAAAHYGRGAMESVMRRTIIGIRLRNEILMLAHGAGDLPAAIDDEFHRAAHALGRA